MSKFKAGDKVRCLKDSTKFKGKISFTKGKIYEVIKDSSQHFWIKSDNQGDQNGWNEAYFELVQEKEKHYKYGYEIYYAKNDEIYILTIDESEHYIPFDKIEDYVEFLVKQKNGILIQRLWWRLEDKFVEE